MSISVFVPGLPIAQGRPRFKAVRMGQFTKVSVYDPKRSEEWKQHVRDWLRSHMTNFYLTYPLSKGIAVSMTLRFTLPRPQRLPKKVRHHVKKPDLDNLVKAVKDALGGTRAKRKKGVIVKPARPGLVYANDSQVVELHARKVYGRKIGVQITVKEMP